MLFSQGERGNEGCGGKDGHVMGGLQRGATKGLLQEGRNGWILEKRWWGGASGDGGLLCAGLGDVPADRRRSAFSQEAQRGDGAEGFEEDVLAP